MTQLILPADLYPRGAERPAYQLLDVRAPVEVGRGALPGAINLPILTDDERREVGICYKERGSEAAVNLGYELTAPAMQERVQSWREVALKAPCPTAVTCWRGGLRSTLTAEFMQLPEVVRVQGGYKAIRNYLLGELAANLARHELVVLAGYTGSGKTALLSEVRNAQLPLSVLDLEALAKHRGSAFGRYPEPQTAQASFENAVALSVQLSPHKLLLVEDESRNIGRLQLPEELFFRLRHAPTVLLTEPLEARHRRIHQDYVLGLSASWGVEKTAAYLQAGLEKLRQRLSNRVTDEAQRSLLRAQGDWDNPAAHEGWVLPLLTGYYDPLYRKGLDKLPRPVLFSGSYAEVKRWLDKPSPKEGS